MPRRAGYASFIGRPNAGKSTLLNTIVGAKVAIVSDKPQTTRSRILAAKNYPEGQIVFVDTPGIHRPLHRLNVRMVDAAVETLREVDVVALVVDAASKMGRGDEYVSGLLKGVKTPVILVLNKVDLVAKQRLLPLIEHTQAMARLRGDRSRLGADRRRRRTPGTCAPGAVAGRGGAVPGGLPDRSARTYARGRNGSREGPAAYPRRAAVRDRSHRGPVRRTGSRSASSAFTAPSSSSRTRRKGS